MPVGSKDKWAGHPPTESIIQSPTLHTPFTVSQIVKTFYDKNIYSLLQYIKNYFQFHIIWIQMFKTKEIRALPLSGVREIKGKICFF